MSRYETLDNINTTYYIESGDDDVKEIKDMELKGDQTKVFVPNAYEIPIRSKKYPKEVPVFIEIKKGSRMKYEWDKDIGMLRLDRVLDSSLFYPHDYGFIPQTLCDDGDPLDVLVMGDNILEPGSIIDVRIIAYMVMEDEKGGDEKVLAVPANDPRYKEVLTLSDIPEHFLREISVFFESYKKSEKEKWVKVGGWKGTEDTQDLVERTHKTWIVEKGKSLIESCNNSSFQKKNETQKIIIDTDPGIDDTFAIHQAFANKKLDVLGITTIFGNVYVEQATRNALWLSEKAMYKTNIIKGASKPLVQKFKKPSSYVHGKEGFGDFTNINPKGKPDKKSANQYLSETIRANSGKIILLAIGPLTNLANLLEYDKEIVNHVKKLVIMGGAVYVPGNITSYAEANFFHDPHAANKVLGADWDIDLIPLDVTTKLQITPDNFSQIIKASPDIGSFISDISKFYINFYSSVYGKRICLMHDSAALIAITNRDIFTFKKLRLSVALDTKKIGKSFISENKSRKFVNVAVNVNKNAAIQIFIDHLSITDSVRDDRKQKILKKI